MWKLIGGAAGGGVPTRILGNHRLTFISMCIKCEHHKWIWAANFKVQLLRKEYYNWTARPVEIRISLNPKPALLYSLYSCTDTQQILYSMKFTEYIFH